MTGHTVDFSLSEEQILLRDSVDKYVREECTVERHRQLGKSDPGFDPAAWQKFAELGWLCVPFSEDLGGFGGRASDMMVIAEALGKGLVREPFLHTVVTCGCFLQQGGTAHQQQRYIPEIIEGNAQWAFAFAEQSSGYDMARVETSARPEGNGYVLNGQKLSVLNAHCADHLIVSARTQGDIDDRDGLSLFIVKTGAAGLSRENFVAVDGSRGAHVELDGVEVSAEQLVGDKNRGVELIESVVDNVIIALGAEAVGAMQTLLDATVEYTKTREQFGQPISKFQALQHRMADMYLKVEEARALLLNAAIQIEQDSDEAPSAAAALKVKVSEAGRYVAQEAVQLHGGMGMTDELIVGHLYKRLMVLSRLYGDESWFLQRFSALNSAAA